MSKRNEEELRGLKKGIAYKSIYEVSEASKLVARSVIEMYHEAGEQVRITQSLPMKMMLFDDNALLFTLEDDKASKDSLSVTIIRRSNLIAGLRELFDIYWEKAMTLDEFKTKFHGAISLEDRKQST